MIKDKNIRNKKSLLQKLRHKYRLIILNEDTFEQKASLRLSRMNLYVLGSVFFVIVVFFVTAVIAFTPLKYYMPGVGSVDVRTQLIEVEMLTDSIQRQLDKRNLWLQNFQMALSGELDSTFFLSDSLQSLDLEALSIDDLSQEELAFREEMRDNPLLFQSSGDATSVNLVGSSYYPQRFESPADGIVISLYDEDAAHYGVDIAGKENENIRAVESGVVVVADWNPETGHVIAVQHKNNTLSFYRHNSLLLKKVGTFVQRGEVIALMGNSGELSSGPHLHFELWQNGKPIDPLKFIVLKKLN
jgi:murein DD-endopeptidase MepM/ murein hydrolase activator NlpD